MPTSEAKGEWVERVLGVSLAQRGPGASSSDVSSGDLGGLPEESLNEAWQIWQNAVATVLSRIEQLRAVVVAEQPHLPSHIDPAVTLDRLGMVESLVGALMPGLDAPEAARKAIAGEADAAATFIEQNKLLDFVDRNPRVPVDGRTILGAALGQIKGLVT